MNADLRNDFPMLRRLHQGRPIVYLDSAASTPSPSPVLRSEQECLAQMAANVNRGRHMLSQEVSAAYEGARARVARFLNAERRSIVFVRGATEALNLVARGLGLQKHDVVLTTAAEHHSNLVPWLREATVVYLEGAPHRPLDPADVTKALRKHRPRVLAIHHVSNVTGVVQPVAELCAAAREYGVISIIDASQSAPHLPLDVDDLRPDFLAFSGHKMLGPKGIGVLFGQTDKLSGLAPLCVGGGAVESVTEEGFVLRPPPEGLEAGTPNVAGAMGLAAAMDYLDSVGRSAIAAHGRKLAKTLREAMKGLPAGRAIVADEEDSVPIASLVLHPGAISADQLAVALSDSFGIMVRSGLLCATPLFARLGAAGGGLRASAYIYNNEQDIACFEQHCQQVLHHFAP